MFGDQFNGRMPQMPGYSGGAGMGGSMPSLGDAMVASGYRPRSGMMGSGPSGYISPAAKTMSRASQMGAGGFSRAAMPGVMTDPRAKFEVERMKGLGVRPGAMPPMSAVAMARAQRPNQAIDPSDPKNAALAGYR